MHVNDSRSLIRKFKKQCLKFFFKLLDIGYLSKIVRQTVPQYGSRFEESPGSKLFAFSFWNEQLIFVSEVVMSFRFHADQIFQI